MDSRKSVILKDFPAAEGLHCSSTSVRKVLEYDGVLITEALAFGLGSGLGFFYLENDDISPARVLNGRAPDLEGSFYSHAGEPLKWAGLWDPGAMAACLEEGRPVLAQTDLFHLPYYQPPVHFPGHGIVVAGVDLDAAEATIMDQGFADPQRTSLKDLRLAMESTAPPLLTERYRWGPAPRIAPGSFARPEVFKAALRHSIKVMEGDSSGLQGLPAMERLARDLSNWADLQDARWCARFAYQSIRKRGTDGASFRFLYAAFLREAGAFVPSLRGSDAAPLYEEAGRCWVSLASLFKDVFVTGDDTLFKACAQAAKALLDAEREALRAMESSLRGLA